MSSQQKHLTKSSAVQILNEISIEYDFAVPTYTVKSLGFQQELPLFQATCDIFKNKRTFFVSGNQPVKRKLLSKTQQLKSWKCFPQVTYFWKKYKKNA